MLPPHTDVKDNDGKTPIHYACTGGHLDMLKYLIEDLKLAVGESTVHYKR